MTQSAAPPNIHATDGEPHAPGEEFQDGLSRRKAAAGLPPADVRRLSMLNPWRSAGALVWTFGGIATVLAAPLLFWHPLVIFAAVVGVAGFQQSLFVLAHDAAHYRLFGARWLNDLAGQFCGMLPGIPMSAYRVLHRLHHNHLYGKIDPDLPLVAGYPRGRAYLLKKLGKDLLGLTAYRTYAYFLGAPPVNTETNERNRLLDDTSPRLRRAALRNRRAVIAFHAAAPMAAFASGWGWEYLILWVLPLVTVLQALLRLRAVLEHGAPQEPVSALPEAATAPPEAAGAPPEAATAPPEATTAPPEPASPLWAARTNLAPAWLRWWLFPHHVNYHIEHHLHPSIPHYRLPEAHRLMAARGVLEDAEVVRLPAALGKIFAEPGPPPLAH